MKALLALALTLVLSGSAFAQESVFGTLGFGLPEDGLSIRSRGMGSTSTALPRIHFGFRNAASLAVFDRTGVTLTGTLQRRSPEDSAGSSSQSSMEFPLLQLVFPLPADFVLGGGVYRYLDFDGFVDTATVFGADSLPVRLTTEGGISVISPQLARRFTRFLRVGGGIDFYTGSRERNRRVAFDPETGVSTTDSIAHDFNGSGFSLGVQIAPFERLLLGASYRSGASLDGELTARPGFGLD
nr:hypothetical protein [Gemmatimonadota bacterium]